MAETRPVYRPESTFDATFFARVYGQDGGRSETRDADNGRRVKTVLRVWPFRVIPPKRTCRFRSVFRARGVYVAFLPVSRDISPRGVYVGPFNGAFAISTRLVSAPESDPGDLNPGANA